MCQGRSRLTEKGETCLGVKYRLVVEGVTSRGRFKIDRKVGCKFWIGVQAGSRRGYILRAVQQFSSLTEKWDASLGLKHRLVVEGVTSWGGSRLSEKWDAGFGIEVQTGRSLGSKTFAWMNSNNRMSHLPSLVFHTEMDQFKQQRASPSLVRFPACQPK